MIHLYSLRDFSALINFYIIHVILMWIFVNHKHSRNFIMNSKFRQNIIVSCGRVNVQYNNEAYILIRAMVDKANTKNIRKCFYCYHIIDFYYRTCCSYANNKDLLARTQRSRAIIMTSDNRDHRYSATKSFIY